MQENRAEETDLEQHRRVKLDELRARGIEPYPNRFSRTHTIPEIFEKFFSENEPVEGIATTAGRLVARRQMGQAYFLHIQDENGKIQVYANNKTLSEEDYFVLSHLDIGDIIGISGEPFVTKTGEKSVRAKELKILTKALSPIPVVKEKDGQTFDAFADVETRYRKRYLDLIVNPSVRADFRTRSLMLSIIRNFFQERGFMEVETPMMQSIASGAAAKPFITHHNTLGIDLYLRIAPELFLKRLLVGGFEKVFEVNRNFRNEGISPKHNPEFTMLETYQAYADYSDMMVLVEDLFALLADELYGCRQFMYGEHAISLEKPWPRVRYLDAIKDKSGIDFSPFLTEENPSFEKAKEMAKSAGVDVGKTHTIWEIVDEVFSQKVEPTLIQPVFITHFPKAISPLAKSDPENPLFVERFEPYIVGREMGNAFSELNDPDEQYERFRQQLAEAELGAEETIALDQDYIEALKTGLPPAGGLGLGIDRMVMLFTNNPTIKDVIFFPLLKPKEES